MARILPEQNAEAPEIIEGVRFTPQCKKTIEDRVLEMLNVELTLDDAEYPEWEPGNVVHDAVEAAIREDVAANMDNVLADIMWQLIGAAHIRTTESIRRFEDVITQGVIRTTAMAGISDAAREEAKTIGVDYMLHGDDMRFLWDITAYAAKHYAEVAEAIVDAGMKVAGDVFDVNVDIFFALNHNPYDQLQLFYWEGGDKDVR